MILKSGDVGPAHTADKPRRIAERLAGATSLGRIVPVIGQWTLPDGSAATLRARRVPPGLDVAPRDLARAIESAFVRRLPDIARDVTGLRVRLEYDREILAGRIRRVEITASAATVAEFKRQRAARLRLNDVRIVLDGVLVNPFSALAEQRLEPLDIGRLRIDRMIIRADDLQAFLAALKGFRDTTVALGEGGIRFVKRQPGPDVAAHVRVVPASDRPFALVATEVTVGGVPVPRRLVDWVMRSYDPSLGLARQAGMPVEIGPVRIRPDAIVIAAEPR
ncbi:MAG: DUF2993 domain-containing protein [Candidatus Rokubacteria bacterium]|nr:DUF2993 domain-containing protein [Candidatus Rokubacteria bacterium]